MTDTRLVIKQGSKWQLVAVSVDTYDDGHIYTTPATLRQFKDLSKKYMVVIYKRRYNGMIQVTQTDDYAKAMAAWNGRHDTLSTSHAAVLTRAYDNETLRSIQGRDSYRILLQEGILQLVKPAGVYL